MDTPREDANCLNCEHKQYCNKATYEEHDSTGKPNIDCYGYADETKAYDI